MAEIPEGGSGAGSTFRGPNPPTYRHPRTSFDYHILGIWQRLTGQTNFGIDDYFREVGGDTLLIDQLMSEVEAITHQRLPPLIRMSANTVRQLADAVLRANPPPKELMTRVKAGLRTPLFFCHGDYTARGFYAQTLADMLHRDQPVFLIHPYLNPDPASTIKDMATSFIAHLLAAQPVGAFRIGGHCNGGLLAWEIAYQLEQLGREVTLLVLIDTISLNARFSVRQIVRLVKLTSMFVPAKVVGRLQLGLFSVRNRWRHKTDRHRRRGRYGHVTANYIPRKIKAAVVVVLSEESRSKREYSSVPWKRLASQVRCKYVSGNHHSSVATNVDELALLFDGLLSQDSAM